MAGEMKRDDNKVDNISELLMSRDKLRKLALLMHLQEAQRIQNVEFRSVYHRIHYLRDSRNTYESAIGILDSVDQIDTRKPAHLQQDDDKVDAAISSAFDHLKEFAEISVGTGCRALPNPNLRNEYLKKIRDFVGWTHTTLEGIKSSVDIAAGVKVIKSQEIVGDLIQHKRLSLDFMNSRQVPPGWKRFSRRIYRHPTDNLFDHVVLKYKAARRNSSEPEGIPNPEESIEVENLETLEVYNEIAVKSGKRSYAKLAKGAKWFGRALMVFQMGTIVYDTIESDHPVQTAVKETVEFGASVGGGIVGEMIGTGVALSVLEVTGIATTTVLASASVLAASIITGFGLAIAVGALTGFLITKLFESGGKTPKADPTAQTPSLKKSVVRHPATENLVIHVAQMPDAERLAHRLTAASA